MIAEMLYEVLRLMPEGQRIAGIVEVRDCAIIVTDEAIYRVSPDTGPLKFVVHRLCAIPYP